MRRFTQLFRELDESGDARDREAALARYFGEAPAADAAWALWLLWGNRLETALPSRRLRAWAAALSGHPDWLVDACHAQVGDLAETAALLLPLDGGNAPAPPLHVLIEQVLQPLAPWDSQFQLHLLRGTLQALRREEATLLALMLTRPVRAGVTRAQLVRALAAALGVGRAALEQRLHGGWQPGAAFFESLASLPRGAAEPPAAEAAPLSVRLVLVYAQVAAGRRDNGFASYAVAARDGDRWVTVAKAVPAADWVDRRPLDEWIGANILGRRGPVRTVPPQVVLEVAYRAVHASARSRSGIELVDPRIVGWCRDDGEVAAVGDLLKQGLQPPVGVPPSGGRQV